MTNWDQPWEAVPLDTEVAALAPARLLVIGGSTALQLSIFPPADKPLAGGRDVYSPVSGYTLRGQFRVSESTNPGRLRRARRWNVPGPTTVAALALACEVTALRAFRVDAIRRRRFGRPLIRHRGVTMTIDEALLRVPHAPEPRITATARVSQVRATYGRMLADIAYRIENSALFDSAVPTTASFERALALWADITRSTPDDEVVRRSALVTVTFDTARAHAETVGLAHLPLTARDQARRALGAARLARSASTDAEREAAEAQVIRILGSLALYYLPGPNDYRRALTTR